MKTTPQPQKKVYYQHAIVKSLIIFSLLEGMLAVSWVWYDWLVRDIPSKMPLALNALVGYSIGSVVLLVFWNTNLEISQEGLTFSSVGFRIYTPWQNIQMVSRVRHPHFISLYTPIDAFVLKEPARLNVSVSEGKRQGMAVVEKHWELFAVKPNSYIWYLPVPKSMIKQTDWEKGELGAFVHLYAPHIFGHS